MSQTLFPENIYEWESCDTSCCNFFFFLKIAAIFFFSENCCNLFCQVKTIRYVFKTTLLHLCLVDCGLNVPMSVTCLARKMASRREKKKVKGNGPNKDSAHEVHRLLETKVNASSECET